MNRLPLLAFLSVCGCAQIQDTPPDPSLANVQVIEMRMPAAKIAQTAREIGNVEQVASGAWRVLAYSELIRAPGTPVCIIVLPEEGEPAYIARLRAHEIRHCRGEQHPGRPRFLDEYSYASEEK